MHTIKPFKLYNYFFSTDNFEFIWLNAAKTAMYAGMYYNPVDPNSPKFSFSMKGVNYTGKYIIII